MLPLKTIIVATIIFFSFAVNADITSWVDENGVRHFDNKVDEPPQNSKDVKKIEEIEHKPVPTPRPTPKKRKKTKKKYKVTTEKERKKKIEQWKKRQEKFDFEDKVRSAINKNELIRGMTKEDVLRSWGEPKFRQPEKRRWFYIHNDYHCFLYFDNKGLLRKWTKR